MKVMDDPIAGLCVDERVVPPPDLARIDPAAHMEFH
jgi:hypothetical protein